MLEESKNSSQEMKQNIDTNLLLWGEMDPGHQKESTGDSSWLELAGQETIRQPSSGGKHVQGGRWGEE